MMLGALGAKGRLLRPRRGPQLREQVGPSY
jgi:hypothetical protein